MSESPPRNTDVGTAILQGACNPESKDVAVELTEIALDTFLKEGVAKEVPILKTILACHKTWEAIHDRLFLRKVARFLVACPKFTDAETKTFLDEQLSDPTTARRLADAMVLILDKLDDMEKPAMLAKMFASLVRRRIGYSDFRRLAAGIDRAFAGDLKIVSQQPTRPELSDERFLRLLEPAGFVSTGGGVSRGGAHGTRTDLNSLGTLFQKSMREE